MSGFSHEFSGSVSPSSSLKKRKRESIQVDAPNLSNNSNPRIISSAHGSNHPLFLNHPNVSTDNEAYAARLQCPPRKRRVQQSLMQSSFSQPLHTNSPHNKLLSPAICVSPSSNVSSPPVSPKTLVPRYAHQQNPCTSASCLRPCHICHRRPTTRELLDAYADCDLCYQRTCYICLRQCESGDCGGRRGFEDEPTWRDTYNSLRLDKDRYRSRIRQPRTVCSRCALEGITETGLEVILCLECVHENYRK